MNGKTRRLRCSIVPSQQPQTGAQHQTKIMKCCRHISSAGATGRQAALWQRCTCKSGDTDWRHSKENIFMPETLEFILSTTTGQLRVCQVFSWSAVFSRGPEESSMACNTEAPTLFDDALNQWGAHFEASQLKFKRSDGESGEAWRGGRTESNTATCLSFEFTPLLSSNMRFLAAGVGIFYGMHMKWLPHVNSWCYSLLSFLRPSRLTPFT